MGLSWYSTPGGRVMAKKCRPMGGFLLKHGSIRSRASDGKFRAQVRMPFLRELRCEVPVCKDPLIQQFCLILQGLLYADILGFCYDGCFL